MFDGFCENALSQGSPAPWIVDDDVNDRINFNFTNNALTNSEMESAVDNALQNMFRLARASGKARVLYGAGECSVDDGDVRPCVEAVSNTEDPDDCGTSGLAWAGCGTSGCFVKICQQAGWAGAWRNGVFGTMLGHELGHAYGLGHVDSGGTGGCTGGVNTGNCGTSDGCDGEMMCTQINCIQSPFPSDGDARGLRERLGPTGFSRQVWWQSDALSDGIDTPARAQFTSGNTAAYHPRIACASSSSPTNQCASVFASRTTSLSTIKVVRLNSPAGSAGWNTQSVVRTLAVTSVMAPDIAVNSSGTVAYIVHVNSRHEPVFVRVPLDGSATTTLSLATVGTAAINVALPPRIEFADGQPRVLVADGFNAGSETFGVPQLRLINVAENGTSAALANFSQSVGNVDLDNQTATGGWPRTHALQTEYDFACRQVGAIARCTIVAQFFHDDLDMQMTRSRSIRFEIDGSATTATLIDSTWAGVVAGSPNNSILGVAVNASANLFVSQSTQITTGTQTANTRVSKFTSESVAGTLSSESTHRGDADSCSALTADGEAFGAAGMHGGYSIAWCPSCGGLDGTLESVSWGDRADGNTHCY